MMNKMPPQMGMGMPPMGMPQMGVLPPQMGQKPNIPPKQP
jgi:hypothetical protein